LEAMIQVYRECWKVLKQSGKLILVTKNFIRDKQVVRLDLSFWRILYKKRFPHVPEIEYEDIMIFNKEENVDGASSGLALGVTEMCPGEEAPTNFDSAWTCKKCGAVNHASRLRCHNCGASKLVPMLKPSYFPSRRKQTKRTKDA